MNYIEIIDRFELHEEFRLFLETNKSLNLPYHNLLHATEMIEDCCAGFYARPCSVLKSDDDNSWNEPDGSMRHLILAAMWHDWGHTGGVLSIYRQQQPDSVNIGIAIEKLQELDEDGYFPQDINVEEVCNIIRATQFPYVDIPNLTMSQKIIRDADLMAAYRPDTLLTHVWMGLSKEMGLPLRALVMENPKFLQAMEPHTQWGKNVKANRLPRVLRESKLLLKCFNIEEIANEY